MGCNGMAFFPANFMLQTSQDQEDDDDNHHQHNQHHRQQQSPIFPPQDFNGVAAFLGGKRSMPLMEQHQSNNWCEDNTNNNTNGDQDELSDDGSLAGDQKKRRLTMEQVKTLEKSFELGNKLEPERKVQLARAVGLQPRQIAIWFQNRRARWKTKQLEKDYDALKRQFDAVKAHNEALQTQNQKLQSQILALTSGREGGGAATGVAMTESFNLNKETIDQGSCSNRSENSSDHQINMVKLDMSGAAAAGPASETSPSQIPTSMPLFPTSSSTTTTNSMRPASSSNLSATQLLFHHNHNPQQHGVKEENFSNMFCGIEDHSGFWPWLDQHQNFN